MNRRTKLLAVCLVISLVFAGWTWTRPYEWSHDAKARYHIAYASLDKDRSYYWVGVHLERDGREEHDFHKPVALVLADGRELEPAEFSNTEEDFQSIDYRFWVEEKDMTGPLRMKLNDGTLTIRKKSGPPPVIDSIRYFNTANW
ncbi:hypothetical protein [Luteolibacter soli]|uniref:Uncharacterized protein n=1 Tax=Luteolibacter soli TaxID=3135280 RepID=A0ABU9AP39_9BACT